MKKLFVLLLFIVTPLFVCSCNGKVEDAISLIFFITRREVALRHSITPNVGSSYVESISYTSDQGNRSLHFSDCTVTLMSADTSVLGRDHVLHFFSRSMAPDTESMFSTAIGLQTEANGDLDVTEPLGWVHLPISSIGHTVTPIDTAMSIDGKRYHFFGSSTSAYVSTMRIPINGETLRTIVTTDTMNFVGTYDEHRDTTQVIYTYYYAPSIGYFTKRSVSTTGPTPKGDIMHDLKEWTLQRYTLK